MRIAVLQMSAAAGDTESNLASIAASAHQAAEGGATILVTPELAVTGYGAGEAMAALASPADGGLISARLDAIAREAGLVLVAGFAEADDGRVFNSALVTDGGDRRMVYRKSFLFGDYERQLFTPRRPSTALLRIGDTTVGVLICYDVEFAENVRRLALAGADVVVVPTALPRGAAAEFIARNMIPVRAYENQVFVAYADLCGDDGLFSYAGLSCIAAPDGGFLAQAPADAETVIFADVDPSRYSTSRAESPYLEDLRRMADDGPV